MAQDTERATQHTECAHRSTGAKWPRTPNARHNTRSVHTSEQEPSGPEHRTRNATQRASTWVTRSQVAQDTAHTCTRRAAGGRGKTNTPWVGRTGATQPTHRASSRGSTPSPLVRARSGCIGDHGKRQPEPSRETGDMRPVHSPGGRRLPSRETSQLKPQGSGSRTVD